MEETAKQAKKPNVLLMITQPIENFKRIKQEPKWILSLVIIIIISVMTSLAIFQFVVSGIFLDAGLGIMMEGDPALTDSIMSGMYIFMIVTTILTAIIAVPIVLLIKSLLFFAIGKLVKSPASFKQYFSLSVHVIIITTIGGVIHLLYNYFAKSTLPDFAFTSLQALIPGEGPMKIVHTSINIFSIWEIIITAIGLQIVAKIPKPTAWTTVILLFILSTGIGVISFILNNASNNLL